MTRNMLTWKHDRLKILVIGETGSGKTSFAGTFPKPFLFSFDGGVDPLAGRDIDYDIFIEDSRKNPSAYKNFLTAWEEKKKDTKYDTLILDNLTALSKFILDDLIWVNNLVDKNLGNNVWDLYRILKNKMYDVCTGTAGSHKHVIATAHPDWETDKNTGEVKVFPKTEGLIRQEMAGWFGEVYYAWVDKKEGKPRYRLKTKADGKYIAKSRLDMALKTAGGTGLPEYIEPTYDSLMSYINQATKK